MRSKNKFLSQLGLILFFVGALVGILFFAGLVWPSLEANFYFGYSGGADTKLRLSCPRIVTPQDKALVRAAVSNKVDRPISPRFQTQISGPIMQVIQSQYTIEPGQTIYPTWEVGSNDLAFGHLIIAQVNQYASYKTPTAAAACGSLFLFVPRLTGGQIYDLALVISMGLVVIGLFSWRAGRGDMTGLEHDQFMGMLLLGGIVLAGIVLGTLAQWILGTLALAIAVLLFIIQIERWLSLA